MSENCLFFLSANFVPQHEMLIKELIDNYNIDIHSVHISLNYSYVPTIDGLFTYKKSEYSNNEILSLIIEAQPKLIYVAGYANKDYRWIAKKARKALNIPVVTGCDTQYRRSFKQKVLKLLFKNNLNHTFTHIWVAGPYQYEWAKKLGYSNDKIIHNLYSGNDKLFAKIPLKNDVNNYPKIFLFAGRLVKEKGLTNLIKAWQSIPDTKGWKIIIAGEGPLKHELEKIEGFELKGHVDQNELVMLAEYAGVYILPSIFEPWGVVIHEFAMAGLPLLCSHQCGATPQFLINAYNGYSFDANSVNEIKKALERIMEHDIQYLIKMGNRSRQSGKNITQQLSAASLMSVVDN